MFAKIFERKWVIRFFGLALILAPFVNTASSVLEIPNIDKKFLFAYCWQYFKSAPVQQQILQIASIVIGTLKLRGSVTAWKYTLALLGGYIILQFTQLNAGVRDNTTWMFLATNVVAFFFIADQIVLKPRPAKQAPVAKSPEAKSELEPQPLASVPEASPAVAQQSPAPPPSVIEVATPNGSVFVAATPAQETEQPQNNQLDDSEASAPESEFAFAPPHLHEHLIPQAPEFSEKPPIAQQTASQLASVPHNNVTPITSHQSSKKVYVNFEGFGKWATVSDISEAGIKVRAISPAPPEITSRTIELTLGSANLRLKFYQQDGAEYSFNFVALSSQDKQSLNQWLLSAAA